MKYRFMMGAAVCALFAAEGASAQSVAPPPATPSGKLETIIVTAQKRSERLQTVPVAVTVFSAKTLQNTNVTNVTDLSGTVPNFQISASGAGPGSSLITLRGLSFQDIEKSFEPPIGLVLDGVYLATSTGQVAQSFDFASIEVLAGPQGTLFGKNTTGGVINITRTKPDPGADGIHGQFQATGGSFGEHDGQAVVTIPLIHDVLALKLAAFSQNNDGAYPDPTIGRNVGARDYQAFNVSLDWRPDPNTDVYFIYDRTTDHSEAEPLFYAGTPNKLVLPIGGGLLVDGQDSICLNPTLKGACPNANSFDGGDTALQNTVPKEGYQLDAFTLNVSHSFDNFRLVSVTGYRMSTEDIYNDYDTTQYTLFNTQRPQYYRQFTEEARYESNFSGPFNIVAGGYFFNSFYHLQEYQQLNLAGVLPFIPYSLDYTIYPGSYAAQQSWNEAIFFQGTYNFNPKLRLIFGARQSWDEKAFNLALYSGGGTSSSLGPLTASVNKYHTWSQFTPKVGIQYQIDPNIMAYFTYSKGYNSGGFNGRAGTLAVAGPYAPEQVHAFEAGVKSTLLDDRLRLNGDVFWNIFNNAQEELIVGLPGGGTSTSVVNAATATFRGAEIEATGKPTPQWTLSSNVGYLNAYYNSFTAALLANPATGQPLVTDNSHLTVRRTPPWTVGLTSDYVIPLPEGQIGLNLNLKYVGHQQLDLLNDPRGLQPGVAKLDLAARYELTVGKIAWTLTGYVKNVTDQTPNVGFVTGYQGSFVELWARDIGRTYGVSLIGKF
jgi:iron complex outermembrane receptor protein